MKGLQFCFVSLLLNLTIFFVAPAYSAPGDVLAQFSINNVSGDGRTPQTPQGIAYHSGFLWVVDFGTDRIYRVYPETVYDEDDVTILFNPGDSDLNIPLVDANDPPINSDGNAIGSCFSDSNGDRHYCGGGGLTFALNYLWNASPLTDDIIKVDPVDGDNLETENTLAALAFPSPTDMTYDGSHFWIVDWQSNTINEVLPEDGRVLSTISGPSSLPAYDLNSSARNARPFGIAWDGRALWVSEQQEDKIYRVDPETGALLNVFNSPGSSPKGLTWDGDSLWHVDQSSNTIYKLDAGVIPIGLLGCVEKNGRSLAGEVLLSQQSSPDQTVTTDPDGCFIFQSFTSGVPLQVLINERGVDEKPIITLNEVTPGSTDISLLVGDTYIEPGFVATDTEDGDISSDVVATPDVINAPILIDTSAPNVYTVSYDVVDSAGNLADTVYRSVSILTPDITPPQITLLGDNPTYVEQDGSYVEAGANALDDRDGDITANILRTGSVDTTIAGSYNLRYDVSDAAGNNAATVIRTVIVQDSTAPIITLVGANPLTHEKGQGFLDPGATASDTTDGDLTSSIIRSGSVPATVGSYVLTYNVSDSSGNAAATVSRTVNVIDTGAPVITLLGSSPLNIERDSVFTDPGATAIDAPSENISSNIVVSGTVNTAIVGSYTLTYNVTDVSGNAAAPVSRIVNVVDSGPVITLNGANPLNHSINTPFIDPGATAFDSADGDLTSSIVSSSNVNVSTVGTYSVSYNVRDTSGNSAPTVTRVVNISDFSAPVITLLGSSPMNIELGANFVDPGATATDNGDGDLTGSIIRSGSVDTSTAGNYVLRYNVSDSAGNAALLVTRTVIVSDTNAPVITLNGSATISHELGQTFNDPGASAFDSSDGNIPVRVSGSVNINTQGTYLLRYDATDSSGNAAVQVIRTVNVINGPTITLLGSNPLNHQINTTFIDPGATAFDNTDGDISSNISTAGSVNSSVAGSYNLVYNARNSLNISAPQQTRVVVVGDFIAPVITLLGSSTVNVEQGSTYIDAGATASDNLDGNITGRIQVSGSVNSNTAGVYVLSYSVTDLSGNAASTVSRTVIVADNIAPTLTLNGSTPMNHEVGSRFIDPGASANDTYTGNISNRIQVTGSVNINAPGSYILTYNVSDAAGNSAPAVTRTVVVADNMAPTLLLNGQSTINHSQGTAFVDPGATANDRYEGNISSRIVVSGTVNPNVPGTYNLRYDVSDSSGNAAQSVSRRVIVGDFNAPIITRLGSASVNLLVGATYNDAGATASDSLDGDLTSSIIVTNPVNTAAAGVYTVRYNVSDLAGNSAVEVTRRVQVTADTTPPVISLRGANSMTVILGTLFSDPGATATDNIDGNISSRIVVSGSVNINRAGNYTLTYRVSDSAGNAATALTRTVTVVAPSNINIQAETGRIVGGPRVRSSQSGYAGSGYIETSNRATRTGDYIEFTSVNAYAVPYSFDVRYSNSWFRRGVIEVRLNGAVVGSINLASTGLTGAWRRSPSITITPRQGNNTIRLVLLDKDGNIDSIRLTPQ